MPAVETFVEAGAVGEAGWPGAGARGVAAIADAAGAADVLAAGAAGRAWATGARPFGRSFLVETCGGSDCGAVARAGAAHANGAEETAGDAAGARGGGRTAAGGITAAGAETGGATTAGRVACGDVAAVVDDGPSRKRVRACPGNVVAIEAPIVTVASQATATPNQPSPLERRTSGALVNAKGAATSGSNARAGGDQPGVRGQVGCAALGSETRRASERLRRMTSSSVSAYSARTSKSPEFWRARESCVLAPGALGVSVAARLPASSLLDCCLAISFHSGRHGATNGARLSSLQTSLHARVLYR